MSSLHKGYLRLAMQSIRASRVRSFMTMLGIVISVMAVVVVVGLSEGVKQQVGNQAERYGDNVLLVRPNQHANALTGSGLPGGTGVLLTQRDVQAASASEGVSIVVPMSSIDGDIFGDQTIKSATVIATTPELVDVINQGIDYGGFLDASDGDHVAVLGSDVALHLFNDNAPLGQRFTFRGQSFIIVGVFKQFVAAPFSLEADYNRSVFIPLGSTEKLLGTAPQINQLFVKTKSDVNVKQVANNVQAAITASRGGSEDTVTLSPGDSGASSNQVLQLLALMTVAVASVALVVGGVGIMNMMLVSVTERIHEIGLRKAIGATNRQILRQFMTEALALSVIGSILGLVGAGVVIALLRLYTSLQPVVVWESVLVAVVVAITTGVLFGSIPALKAARMDPIEALRHE